MYSNFHFACILFQLVNVGSSTVNLKIFIDGLEINTNPLLGSTKTLLTSNNMMDENSFNEPKKVW